MCRNKKTIFGLGTLATLGFLFYKKYKSDEIFRLKTNLFYEKNKLKCIEKIKNFGKKINFIKNK